MQSKSLHELKENARLYKSELMKILFDADSKPFSAKNASGQTIFSGEFTDLAAIPNQHNVLGIGYGLKVSAASSNDEIEAIRIYVRAKVPKKEVSERDLIPTHVNGRPTDVIAVGSFDCYRPVFCGVSIGHKNITAGTLGCVVEKDGTRFILSNNHVLADCNNGKIGDFILEPGKHDGGKDAIAHLADFEPLHFNGPNYFDAAIAKIIDPAEVNPEIDSIGQISEITMSANLGVSVRKTGRTTKHTTGRIRDISADVKLNYGQGRVVGFVDQLSIEDTNGQFGAPGDSGALVLSDDKVPIGLLFGGGQGETLASPIDQVLERFGVKIIS